MKSKATAFTRGWKAAAREAAVKAGHFDGRFSPSVVTDARKERERLLCRERVEAPLGEAGEDAFDGGADDFAPSDHEADPVFYGDAPMAFTPFQGLI